MCLAILGCYVAMRQFYLYFIYVTRGFIQSSTTTQETAIYLYHVTPQKLELTLHVKLGVPCLTGCQPVKSGWGKQENPSFILDTAVAHESRDWKLAINSNLRSRNILFRFEENISYSNDIKKLLLFNPPVQCKLSAHVL